MRPRDRVHALYVPQLGVLNLKLDRQQRVHIFELGGKGSLKREYVVEGSRMVTENTPGSA